jgi:hypothetical protein
MVPLGVEDAPRHQRVVADLLADVRRVRQVADVFGPGSTTAQTLFDCAHVERAIAGLTRPDARQAGIK